MKVQVIKKDNAVSLQIYTDFIKLQDAMKFANVVMSGGEAKQEILDGRVKVNGEICTMRGKKLYNGDTFAYMGGIYRILSNAAE